MDRRDPVYLPEGWVKSLRNKRVVFLTPKPTRIVIQSRSMLSDYQNKGQFRDVHGARLDFRSTGLSISDASHGGYGGCGSSGRRNGSRQH